MARNNPGGAFLNLSCQGRAGEKKVKICQLTPTFLLNGKFFSEEILDVAGIEPRRHGLK